MLQLNLINSCRKDINVNRSPEMVVALTVLWRWFKVNTCHDKRRQNYELWTNRV